MKLLNYVFVLLWISSISTEVIFSPSTLPLQFRIPSMHVVNTTATLTSNINNDFSWEIVQKIGECEPITVSPQIGSGYNSAKLYIYINTALLKADLHNCTISALCSTNNSQNILDQNIADLIVTYEVTTEYCYDQPSYFCGTFTHSHCNKTTGLCDCDKGFYGKDCQRECVEGPIDNMCGDHGHCNTAPDMSYQECICEDHYYPVSFKFSDTGCSVFCDPALNCTGNAHCSDQGRCECDEGYHGSNCSTYCTEEFCSFAGKCSVDGTCQCNTGRYGDQCQYITCPYCVHGTCNNRTGTCECSEGYSGAHCDKYCGPTTCGEHGHCSFDGCKCEDNWYGTSCQNYCNSTMCNHGTCASDGKSCKCDQHWDGPQCDKDCTCNNHGKCDSHYECQCDNDYYGPTCDIHCNDAVDCGLNGRCDHVTGQCICGSDYYGHYCVTYCNPALTCNSHGSCNAQGQCECDEGYSGSSCYRNYSPSPSSSPDSSSTSTPQSNPRPSYLLLIIFAIAVAVVLVIGIVAVVKCVKKRREKPYELIAN